MSDPARRARVAVQRIGRTRRSARQHREHARGAALRRRALRGVGPASARPAAREARPHGSSRRVRRAVTGPQSRAGTGSVAGATGRRAARRPPASRDPAVSGGEAGPARREAPPGRAQASTAATPRRPGVTGAGLDRPPPDRLDSPSRACLALSSAEPGRRIGDRLPRRGDRGRRRLRVVKLTHRSDGRAGARAARKRGRVSP